MVEVSKENQLVGLNVHGLPHILILAICMLLSGPLSAQPPNFVIMILDDWGWEDSGAYGNTRIQTPNIDQLAAEGVRFNNAFLTSSVCSPSRASILSGLYPLETGAPRLGKDVPVETRLVATWLREAGYYTASAGKWHLGLPITKQFDRVVRTSSDSVDESLKNPHKALHGMEDWLAVIDETSQQSKPFFLWLASKDPHRPWFFDMRWSIHQPSKIEVPGYFVIRHDRTTELNVRQEFASYYDEVSRADYFVGQVIERLHQVTDMENTIVILMSDNGAPFHRAKRSLFDSGLKTPFIVYAPSRFSSPGVVDGLVSAVDIVPTILELAGVNTPEALPGVSFLPMLKNNSVDIRSEVYAERHLGKTGSPSGRSIRTQDYLYIFDETSVITGCSDEPDFGYFSQEQLYDVHKDPFSFNNLAREQEYTSLVHQFRASMFKRREERKDRLKPVVFGECPKRNTLLKQIVRLNG